MSGNQQSRSKLYGDKHALFSINHNANKLTRSIVELTRKQDANPEKDACTRDAFSFVSAWMVKWICLGIFCLAQEKTYSQEGFKALPMMQCNKLRVTLGESKERKNEIASSA